MPSKPSKPFKTVEARTVAQWRAWLAEHHDSESEVWLIFLKRHTGRPSIAYEDAVNEALCFGWVDSLIRRLDDARYARKFTPRKPGSRWSTANRRRYARLKAAGRLTAARLKLEPTDRSGDVPRLSAAEIPRYIQDALKNHPAAWNHFERLAPSYRRMYIGWIDSAKRQETKMRRLQEAIRLLAEGKKLGLK
ncbi:MAG: YdeI/OmpD-associated family protein [Candidatus Aminicenantales bacterium]